MMTTSAVRATAITCRPRPFPGQAEGSWLHSDVSGTRVTPPSPQLPRLLSFTDLPSATSQAMISLALTEMLSYLWRLVLEKIHYHHLRRGDILPQALC